MILPNCLEDRVRHALLRHWNFQADRASRIPQTIQMFAKPENAPVVKANALENSVAVQQTMVEDGDLRVRFGVKFSVDVNLRFLHAQRSGPWATFNSGFTYRIRSRFFSFGFV